MKNCLVLQLSAICALVLLVSVPIRAQPVPWVYRTDSRPPEDVFANGFETRGALTSLFDHVFLGSCRAQALENRSSWVSTIGRRTFALHIADGILQSRIPMANRRGQNGLWLYTIHPDVNYLSVMDVLRQAMDAGNHEQNGYYGDHAQILERAIADRNILEQNEVVTQHVYPTNIASAVFVSLVPIAAVNPHEVIQEIDGSGVSNPGYRPPISAMTSQVDTINALIPPSRVLGYPLQRRERAQSCLMQCDGASFAADTGNELERADRKRRSQPSTAPYCAAGPSRTEAFMSSED